MFRTARSTLNIMKGLLGTMDRLLDKEQPYSDIDLKSAYLALHNAAARMLTAEARMKETKLTAVRAVFTQIQQRYRWIEHRFTAEEKIRVLETPLHFTRRNNYHDSVQSR